MSEGPFRNDRDADHARIAALEAQLAESNARVEQLEAHRSHALVLATPATLAASTKRSVPERLAGAPLTLELRRTFAGALSADHFETLVDRIRALTGERGRTEMLRASFTWTSVPERRRDAKTTVTLTVRDGSTELVVDERLTRVANGTFGPIVGGTSGIGFVLGTVVGFAINPVIGIASAAAFYGSTYTGARALYRRTAKKRAEKLQQLFDALGDEVDRALP